MNMQVVQFANLPMYLLGQISFHQLDFLVTLDHMASLMPKSC